MKICDGTTGKKTQFSELKVGDIFAWGTHNKDHACIRLENTAYVTIASTAYPDGIGEISSPGSGRITHYPNACITLGDPE